MATLHADLDEMTAEAKVCDEKAGKAMVDAARIADELRAEQESAMGLSKGRKLAEIQVKDMQNKLESRIRELQSELEAENRRHAEGQRNLKKSERHIEELTFSADEDRKDHERMQSLVDSLQAKIKSYKQQIEEAEEVAALNLAKFRKVQGSLSEVAEDAEIKEAALAKAKRGRSLGPC